MAYITVQDLTLGYEGRPIAEGLHFTVNAGDYLCIVGENGSGKTTLMRTPEQYVGKTVKMEGLFASYHAESTGNTYFACIIRDATACCAQGIEFILTDDYVYPDDYPEVNEEICVCGVFDQYREGRYTYYTLRDAKLL